MKSGPHGPIAITNRLTQGDAAPEPSIPFNKELGMPENMRHDIQQTRDAGLARLDELDDYKVADGDPDIRGWNVKTFAGQKVGKVEELIVDKAAMRVRYMDVKVDKSALNTSEDRHILVPIGTARLDDERDDVLIHRLPAGGFAKAPAYTGGRLTRDYERSLHDAYGSDTAGSTRAGAGETAGESFYGSELYDDRRFWGNRRRGRENTAYVTRSEEELAVGTRPVKSGEVEVKKRVETKHVKEQVPTAREEITVERRPPSGMAGSARIEEDEITIPVMEEQAVVQKRAVPKEEVVIHKETKRDQKTVEADLRKERVDVNPKGDVDVQSRQR